MDKIVMDKIVGLQLDKLYWKPVKFGDVTIQQKKKVDRENTDLTRYVKGEHMGSEDLHLRSWGDLQDEYLGPAFIRKVVLAPFSGITSNTTFVIKANENVLDKRLLPFIMLSEGFAENSIRKSKGSVNPYVNWKDLANYEFLLPPKDQQAQLAELLWAMDAVLEREREAKSHLGEMKKAKFRNQVYIGVDEIDEVFGRWSSRHEVYRLGGLLETLQYGISESLDTDGAIPILRMNNLQDGKLALGDLKYYTPTGNELEKFILEKGDVLFNRTNSFDLVGKVSLFNVEGQYSFASYLIRLKVDEERLDPRFLNFYLNSTIGVAKIRRYRTPGVSQSNINAQSLKKLPIPLPSMAFQKELMDGIGAVGASELKLANKIEEGKSLLRSLINQIF